MRRILSVFFRSVQDFEGFGGRRVAPLVPFLNVEGFVGGEEIALQALHLTRNCRGRETGSRPNLV